MLETEEKDNSRQKHCHCSIPCIQISCLPNCTVSKWSLDNNVII